MCLLLGASTAFNIAAFAKAVEPGIAELIPNYTSAADTLKALGLFRGSDNGYELEREPTRAEAVTMLVRFLGKEKTALDNAELGVPPTYLFEDVPEWCVPYVTYCWNEGLTNGVSSTEFGATMLCDAKMYCTFLLRSLGYKDGRDFMYDNAVSFATEVGVADAYALKGNFTRGSMVALSELALTVPPKEGKHLSLAAKLMQDGAIAASEPFIERANAFAKLRGAFMGFANSEAYDVFVRYSVSNDGFDESEAQREYNYIFTDRQTSNIKFEYTDSTGLMYFYYDGLLFVRDTENEPYSIALGEDDAREQLSAKMDMGESIYLLNNFQTDFEGEFTVYAIVYTEIEKSDIAYLLGDDYEMSYPGLKVENIITETYVTSDGRLERQNMLLTATYSDKNGVHPLQAIQEFIVNRIGGKVTLTVPKWVELLPKTATN
jgi:hypothetical protein